MGTIGGSIMSADHLSDLYPPLIAADARLTLQALGKSRSLPLRAFLENGKPKIEPEEVLTHIYIPLLPTSNEVQLRKVSKRISDCQTILTTAFVFAIESPESPKVSLSFSGFGRTPGIMVGS